MANPACAHCGSLDTQWLAQTIQCNNCGRQTTASGEKSDGGRDPVLQGIIERQLQGPRTVVAGNLADLQRMGAENAPKKGEKAFVMPPTTTDNVVTPAEDDALQGLETRETIRAGIDVETDVNAGASARNTDPDPVDPTSQGPELPKTTRRRSR